MYIYKYTYMYIYIHIYIYIERERMEIGNRLMQKSFLKILLLYQ